MHIAYMYILEVDSRTGIFKNWVDISTPSKRGEGILQALSQGPVKGVPSEMGHHCCSKQKVKRGLWSPEEDEKLVQYITAHGHGCWSAVPKQAGLQRCGKSCRLRWINYLRPDLKRGTFTEQEERIIIDVHRILGNRWAQIAKHLPGRTDNEVKNFWNSCIKKKLIAQGLDPKTHNLLPSSRAGGGSSSNASNLPPISTAPFTIISSSVKNSNAAGVRAKSSSASRPVVTLPSYTGLLRHRNMDAAQEMTLQRQEPEGLLMSFRSQEHPQTSPADYCSGNGVISSPLLHAQLVSSAFSLMEEASMLWSPAADQTTPCAPNHPSAQQMIDGGHDLGHTTVPNFGVGEQPGQQKDNVFDPSYGTAGFDLDLIDMAPLIPGDAFCGASSMEPFRWDC